MDINQVEYLSTMREFSPLWHLPNRLKTFTGRAVQLKHLNDAFQNKNQHMVIQQSKKITGTGGIGKTQLAVQFAHEMIQQKRYQQVIWFNADTSLYDQLHMEFVLLANALGLNTNQIDTKQLVQSVYEHLTNHGNTLIIFDNAITDEAIQVYLPPKHLPLSVLVTTRDNNTWDMMFEQLALDIFSAQEAIEYVNKALTPHLYDKNQAQLLTELLGRFPLGLAQAVGYITTVNISIEVYMDHYLTKKHQIALLDKKPLHDDPHQETIWLTVNLCMEKIESDFAKQLMGISALLAAESPIETAFFNLWCADPSITTRGIEQLLGFSLLEDSSLPGHVRVHQLVQEIILLIDPHDHDDRLHKSARNMCDFSSIEHDTLTGYQRKINLLPHIKKLVNSFESTKYRHDVMILKLECLNGAILDTIGDYKDELTAFDHALAISNEIPDIAAEPLLLASIYNGLANAHGNFGNFVLKIAFLSKSIELYTNLDQKIIDGEKTTLPLLYTYINLANAYHSSEEYQKQVDVLIYCINLIEKHELPDSSYLAHAYQSLATGYSALRQYELAELYYEKCLKIEALKYGDDHPETLTSKINLARIYIDTNRKEQGIALLEHLKLFAERHYGESHPIVARILHNLSFGYAEQGNLDKQIQLLKYALALKCKFYSSCNPETAKIQSNLAAALANANELEQAHALIKEAYNTLISCSGITSKVTMKTQYQYISILERLKHYVEAEEICLNTIAHIEGADEIDDLQYIEQLETLLKIYKLQNSTLQAVSTLKKVLFLYTKVYGENDPKTAAIKIEYAILLSINIDHLENAISLLEEAKRALAPHQADPTYKVRYDDCEKMLALLQQTLVMKPNERYLVYKVSEFTKLEPQLNTARIDNLKVHSKLVAFDHIYQLIEICIDHDLHQLALSLLRELRERGHISITTCEHMIECCLHLKFINDADLLISVAFEMGDSDRIFSQFEQLSAIKIIYEQDKKDIPVYVAKSQTSSACAKDFILLAIQCIKIGEYKHAVKYLSTSLITQSDDKIRAAAEYQKARCALLEGNIHLAQQFIAESLLLNPKVEKAEQLFFKINEANFYQTKLVEVIQKIAWDEIPTSDELNQPLDFTL